MNTKHKWYDVIVAWANGEEIQSREYRELSKLDWKDFPNDYTPNFSNLFMEWRVKPKTTIKKYRMALVKDIGVYNVVALDIALFSLDFPAEREIQGFIRWVGDVVEVEIEL